MDHIIPVINRFKAKQKNIENTFEIKSMIYGKKIIL